MSSTDDKLFRNKVYKKIKKIKNKQIYTQIYDIIIQQKQDYNINSNGVFFDIYKISTNTVQLIDLLLQNLSVETEEDTTTYNNYSEEISITKKSIEETDIDKKIISHSIL